MKGKLTDKQLEVFLFMRDFFRENDMLPTQKALGEWLGLKDDNAGAYYQRNLERKGYIERNAVGKYRFARETNE